MTSTPLAAVIILAAGEGTRMRSATPKVLHRIGGRSLLEHAVLAARAAEPEHVVVVVRSGADAVVEHLAELDANVLVAFQDEIPGTGRATRCGLAALPPDTSGTVLVTMGDTPLLRGETLRRLVDDRAGAEAAVTLLTMHVDDPTGYGRIVRDDAGDVRAIVEHRDASASELEIAEVNAGVYAFDLALLSGSLDRVGTENTQREQYLTDVVALLHGDGHRLAASDLGDAWQTAGVNDRVQLAAVGAELNRRVVEHWMRSGVTVVDPATTWIDVDVSLGRDVTIRPQTQLLGATTIGDDVVVGPECTLTDVEVGDGASLVRTQATLAVIGAGASVGPFAFVRPGTELGPDGKIGGFVETKNATIGAGAKVPHLAYVGDAEIGPGSNIGAGTIFANYDGQAKHRITVGAEVRSGANNTFVAPVVIGDGAATGAGTVVREDVAPGELSVSAGPQRHLTDWVARRRPGTSAARAAAEALQRQSATDQTPEEHDA